MAKPFLLLLGAAVTALASLNCTTTAEVKTYCCPDTSSEVVKTSPAASFLTVGCAVASNKSVRQRAVPVHTETRMLIDHVRAWFWDYNGLYTPFTADLKDCNLGGMPFPDLKGGLPRSLRLVWRN